MLSVTDRFMGLLGFCEIETSFQTKSSGADALATYLSFALGK